nr:MULTISPECIES: hypothetical protein [unclassified Citrobacter]
MTDPGLVKAGILPPVLHSLQEAGFQVTVYDRVQPDRRNVLSGKPYRLLVMTIATWSLVWAAAPRWMSRSWWPC